MNKDFTRGPRVLTVPLAVLCIMGCSANRVPVPTPGLGDIFTSEVGQRFVIDLSEYFDDADGDALMYAAAIVISEAGEAEVARLSPEGDTQVTSREFRYGSELALTAVRPGTGSVLITARDPGGGLAQRRFTVSVLPSVPVSAPETAPPSAAPTSMAGRTIKDCDVCPTMIVVPTGNFVMGAPPGEQGRDDSEGPDHVVEIPDEFAVGVYEVTFAEWEACVNAGRCGGLVPEGGGPGMGGHPVINVSWQDVEGYLEWLTERTGFQYRMPTEAEWEYVARGGTQTPRYWGPTAAEQCRYANGADGEAPCPDGHLATAPVGVLLPNGFGLHDVLGNVWEWTQDCWNDRLSNSPRADAVQSGDCARRVVRGGSAFDGPNAIRAASRGSYPAAARVARVGFRVARALN